MIDYNFYKIITLTNMHVGSGDINFGVVDNLIQREPASNFPYINSSSLKGALREFFVYKNLQNDKIIDIFGSSPQSDKNGKRNNKQGKFYFFNAYILSIPARSDIIPYFNATCPQLLNMFINTYKTYNRLNDIGKDKISKAENFLKNINVFLENGRVLISNKYKDKGSGTVEDLTMKYFEDVLIDDADLKNLLGDNIAVLNDRDFIENISNNMPVIARNYLENGMSKNLWYEEIVPRDSRFFFIIGSPKDDNLSNEFSEHVKSEPVQIGANASIGYGFCNIEII